MAVHFIDTSVLCNLVPVPGRDDDRGEVLNELRRLEEVGDDLILPVTAVVETGNFIAQLSDGRLRRTSAQNLAAQLQFAVDGQAPYTFHDFGWTPDFVTRFIAGAETGRSMVDLAVAGVGAGDLLILTEVAAYRRRSRLPVRLWTRDQQLRVHD